MRVRLIKRWKPVEEYNGWTIEKAVYADFDGCEVPAEGSFRARKHRYVLELDRSECGDDNAVVLALMSCINHAEGFAGEEIDRDAGRRWFETYEEAKDYAEMRFRNTEYVSMQAIVGTNKWRFHRHTGGVAVGEVIERNAI